MGSVSKASHAAWMRYSSMRARVAVDKASADPRSVLFVDQSGEPGGAEFCCCSCRRAHRAAKCCCTPMAHSANVSKRSACA
ncbi:hypothetical protein [Paraburkholderia terrae]